MTPSSTHEIPALHWYHGLVSMREFIGLPLAFMLQQTQAQASPGLPGRGDCQCAGLLCHLEGQATPRLYSGGCPSLLEGRLYGRRHDLFELTAAQARQGAFPPYFAARMLCALATLRLAPPRQVLGQLLQVGTWMIGWQPGSDCVRRAVA
eukprot:1157138-Pelagomonas_calceolata.AAC.2